MTQWVWWVVMMMSGRLSTRACISDPADITPATKSSIAGETGKRTSCDFGESVRCSAP